MHRSLDHIVMINSLVAKSCLIGNILIIRIKDACIYFLNVKFIVLHLLQLRGRVGRSGREGFAYLFYTDKSLLSRVATVSSAVDLIFSYWYPLFVS